MRNAFYSLLFLLVLPTANSWATHIRAGEIIARRISETSLTFEIILRGYADLDSPVIFGSNGTLVFGDGTQEILRNTGCDEPFVCANLDAETRFYEAKFIHTYPGPGTYTVSFYELYRNEGVQNITNSVNTPFYVETLLIIDPFIGVNNTPELFAPPIEEAAVAEIYIHNPAAFDPDGDSLSYRLVPNKEARGVVANGYRFPHQTFPAGDERNGFSLPPVPGGDPGPPLFYIDPVVGDLVWNTPGYGGEGPTGFAEYNAAFIVEEWRKINGDYVRLGYVTRDMQIIVHNSENNPPEIEPVQEICVVAGETIEFDLNVSDPEDQDIFVELLSGAEFNAQARLDIDNTVVPSPSTGKFTWTTTCDDIRAQPWLLTFRATDQGRIPELSDVETVIVRIVGPPPTIDNITVSTERTAEISFDFTNYLGCLQQVDSDIAEPEDADINLQLWRRVGEGPDIVADTCNPGMPPNAGYQLISTIQPDEFPFTDQGLQPGLTYCYALVVEFPFPEGGLSLVGEPYCVSLPAAAPLITKVSVVETDPDLGEILVNWIKPPEPEGLEPFTYELYGGPGFASTQNGYELLTTLADGDNLEYNHSGLNTQDLVYNYKVLLYDANGMLLDSSATASSVRLSLIPQDQAIQLNWEAQVPWTIQSKNFPIHEVYRAIRPENQLTKPAPEDYALLAEVNVNEQGLQYVDQGEDLPDGLDETSEYFYYVLTRGSYQTPETSFLDPLRNFSQVASSFTRDSIPPCKPFTFEVANFSSCEEFLASTDCESIIFENELVWETSGDSECGNDIGSFEIYYSRDGTNFSLLATVGGSVRSYLDDLSEVRSFARYYYIVAIDQSGNRSERSPVISRDNCPNYWLPNFVNVSSTYGNEELRPPMLKDLGGGNQNYAISEEIYRTRCPRFVEQVILTVYNRWGKEIYYYNSDEPRRNASGELISPQDAIYINWDGTTNGGEKVSAGTYYYTLEIRYNVLDPAKQQESRSGWVDIYDVEQNQPE